MSVYTVHEPPLRATQTSPDPARFVFVRDGFSVWAFLVAALWMLWHRMWLVFILYIAVAIGVQALLRYAGVSSAGTAVVEILISLLVGIEAGTLRRFTLARRGWNNIGVVTGDDLEAAEWRFFGAWNREAPVRQNAASLPPSLPPVARTASPPEVIGLFPEPGANR